MPVIGNGNNKCVSKMHTRYAEGGGTVKTMCNIPFMIARLYLEPFKSSFKADSTKTRILV